MSLLLVIIILSVFLLLVALLVIGVVIALATTQKEKKEFIRVSAEAQKIDAMAASGKITTEEARDLKQTLGPIAFTETSREPDVHIKVIGILNIIFAFLGIVGGGGLFFVFVLGFKFSTSRDIGGGGASPMAFLVLLPLLFILAVVILRIVSASCLMKGRSWARIAIIIFAILGIISFPIGTALGIYTLWALLFREDAGLYFIADNTSPKQIRAGHEISKRIETNEVCYLLSVTRPEGPIYHSPGQRPGYMDTPSFSPVRAI